MDIFTSIDQLINQHPVTLFMKGTADFPQCGFSSTVVHILRLLQCEFHVVNVLADNEMREGIKSYSQWPTIPQLYVNQQFVGGCDIVRSMYESGQLAELLAQHCTQS